MGRGDFLAVAEGRVTRFQAAHVSPREIREVVTGIGDGGWDESWNGGWRVESEEGEVLPARLSPVAPSGRVALPWSVGRLSEMFRGGAQE
jgi:hypothetical protein